MTYNNMQLHMLPAWSSTFLGQWIWGTPGLVGYTWNVRALGLQYCPLSPLGLAEGDVHYGGKNRFIIVTGLFRWKSEWA